MVRGGLTGLHGGYIDLWVLAKHKQCIEDSSLGQYKRTNVKALKLTAGSSPLATPDIDADMKVMPDPRWYPGQIVYTQMVVDIS